MLGSAVELAVVGGRCRRRLRAVRRAASFGPAFRPKFGSFLAVDRESGARLRHARQVGGQLLRSTAQLVGIDAVHVAAFINGGEVARQNFREVMQGGLPGLPRRQAAPVLPRAASYRRRARRRR